jgi:hypothetical protein
LLKYEYVQLLGAAFKLLFVIGPDKNSIRTHGGWLSNLSGVTVGFDVGNVLSAPNTGDKLDGDLIYRAMTNGAYACFLLCVAVFGAANCGVVSRTNTGKWYSQWGGKCVEHWVVRFLRQAGCFQMGMPEDNVKFVTEYDGAYGKGPKIAELRFTHFIDDHRRCGIAALTDGGCWRWIHFDAGLKLKSKPYDPGYARQFGDDRYVGCAHFWQIVTELDLTNVPGVSYKLFQEISEYGPPSVRHNDRTLPWLTDVLRCAYQGSASACLLALPSALDPPSPSSAEHRRTSPRDTSSASSFSPQLEEDFAQLRSELEANTCELESARACFAQAFSEVATVQAISADEASQGRQGYFAPLHKGEVFDLLYVGNRTTKDEGWAYVRRPGKPEEEGWLRLCVLQVTYASLGLYELQRHRYIAALRSVLEANTSGLVSAEERSCLEQTLSEVATVKAIFDVVGFARDGYLVPVRTGEVLELLYVGSRTTKDQEWAYVRRPGKPEEAGWLSLLVVQVTYASLGIHQMQEHRYSAAVRSDLEAARSDQEANTSELASVRACLAQLLSSVANVTAIDDVEPSPESASAGHLATVHKGEVLELLYVGSLTTKDKDWVYVRRPGKPEEKGWLRAWQLQRPTYASLQIYAMQPDCTGLRSGPSVPRAAHLTA